MREHLLDCLDQGRISGFPISRERSRLPLGRRIRHSILEDIHCLCGMPNDEAEPMIVCESCQLWFHGNCECKYPT